MDLAQSRPHPGSMCRFRGAFVSVIWDEDCWAFRFNFFIIIICSSVVSSNLIK